MSNTLDVVTNISAYITSQVTFFELPIHSTFVHDVTNTCTMTANYTQLTILTWSFQK